jgi:acid phosphatase family membrane protein YuiD
VNSNWLSIYLIVPAVAWFVAQTLKALLELNKPKQHRNREFFRSGSMPSVHSTMVASLLTVLGVRQGVDSPLFAVAAVMAAIVLYDAVNVRRSVGEQGDTLRKLVAKDGEQPFFIAYGHKLSEILIGFMLGVLIALALLQIL